MTSKDLQNIKKNRLPNAESFLIDKLKKVKRIDNSFKIDNVTYFKLDNGVLMYDEFLIKTNMMLYSYFSLSHLECEQLVIKHANLILNQTIISVKSYLL